MSQTTTSDRILIGPADVRAMTGLRERAARNLVRRLEAAGLRRIGSGGGTRWMRSEFVRVLGQIDDR
jgi:hypothetical protein